MKSITVFCGASDGYDDHIWQEAFKLGQILADKKIKVIYGGAQIGIMGAVADGSLSKNGEVIGVIPDFLKTKEVAHDSIKEMIVVETMHERKTILHELCDGVIVLPGGWGTLEELFEFLTWGQLGLHSKPIALLNVNGFFDSLIHFIQVQVDNGFLKEKNQNMLIVSDNIEDLLKQMKNYVAPKVKKWITESET